MSEEEDLKYLQTEYEENIITELIKKVEELQNQLQQKENIIKEVREIFKDYGDKEDIVGYTMYNITGEMLITLLEILEKGDEK